MSLVAAIALSLAAASSCPAEPALARLTAASDRIVVGTFTTPEALDREAARSSPDSVDLPLLVSRALKGQAPAPDAVLVYSKAAPHQPDAAALKARAGTPAILFVADAEEGPRGFHFAGYTPQALQAASPERVAAVTAEVARQQRLLAAWKPDRKSPHFKEVRRLVARLGRVSGAEQQQAFSYLESLGPDAVPAIVAVMDDRRRVKFGHVSLAGVSPDGLAISTRYSVDQVVDALSAVLSQITGENLGRIGASSDRERALTVSVWRVYTADLACGTP
ncbi:hypothetical protein AS593_12500 [Caulobacter vibrioides]|nr:hypothetical protein AS593_12500 [Caulobacter vibrioides]